MGQWVLEKESSEFGMLGTHGGLRAFDAESRTMLSVYSLGTIYR